MSLENEIAKYIPSDLKYIVNSLSNYSRETVYIQPMAKTSYSQNEQISFLLPDNSYVDFSTLRVLFNLSTGTAVAANAYLQWPKWSENLINQIKLTSNGIPLTQTFNYYNLLQNTLSNMTMGIEANQSERGMMGLGDMGAFMYSDASNNTGTAKLANVPCVWSYWIGLPDCILSTYMNYGLPMLKLDIFTAPNSIAYSATANATVYTLSDMHMEVDVIKMQPDLYQLSLSLCESLGRAPQFCIKQYYSYQENSASNLKFTTSTSCLNKVIIIPKADSFNTASATSQDLLTTSYFISTPRTISTYYLRIGSQMYPNFIINDTSGLYAYELSKKCFAKQSDVLGGTCASGQSESYRQRLFVPTTTSGSQVYYTSATGLNAGSKTIQNSAGQIEKWLNANWCLCYGFEHLDSATQDPLLTGINTIGTSNSNFFVSSGLEAGSTIILFTESTSVITLTPNGVPLITY